ncbi:DUF3099 domain-containing protein [Corynebacterium imitans]|uniref:DUF3099 domain-containing protein n=1 Tax=Corynebacterium imitans TaxID=156978 RepID=UPI001EF1BCE7|nr:DUF3099 domain-containing protein [Corynebacterium imitans]MCG7277579.1 DUF3099 domain-containing protein [Corynebacterium imitans]
MSGSQHYSHDASPGESDPHVIDAPLDHDPAPQKRRFRRRSRRALITDATRTPEQNRQSREKQYLILQGLRLPLIALSIGAAVAGHWWWAAAIFGITLPLPWVSVMIANGQGEVREKRERNVYKPAVAREQARQAALAEQARAQLSQSTAQMRELGPTIIDADTEEDTEEPDEKE